MMVLVTGPHLEPLGSKLLPKTPVKSLRAFEKAYKKRLLELGYSMEDYTDYDMITLWISQFVLLTS